MRTQIKGRSQSTGRPTMRFPYDPWAAPRYLRKPDLDSDGWSDWEAIEQLQMQRKLESSIHWAIERGENF